MLLYALLLSCIITANAQHREALQSDSNGRGREAAGSDEPTTEQQVIFDELSFTNLLERVDAENGNLDVEQVEEVLHLVSEGNFHEKPIEEATEGSLPDFLLLTPEMLLDEFGNGMSLTTRQFRQSIPTILICLAHQQCALSTDADFVEVHEQDEYMNEDDPGHDEHEEDGEGDNHEEGHEGHDHDEHEEEGEEGDNHEEHEEGHEGHDHSEHEEGHEGHVHSEHEGEWEEGDNHFELEEGHEGHDHSEHEEGHEGHDHSEHEGEWEEGDNHEEHEEGHEGHDHSEHEDGHEGHDHGDETESAELHNQSQDGDEHGEHDHDEEDDDDDNFRIKLVALSILFVEAFFGSLVPISLGTFKGFKQVLSILNCFAGGVLFATGVIHLIPHVMEYEAEVNGLDEYPLGMVVVAGSFAFVFYIEHILFDVHVHGDDALFHGPADMSKKPGDQSLLTEMNRLKDGLLLLAATSVHSILEALVLGLEDDSYSLWLLFASIAGHKGVTAMALASRFSKAEATTRQSLLFSLLFALTAPVAILIGTSLDDVPALVNLILTALSTGTFLYIGAYEVIGEEFQPKHETTIGTVEGGMRARTIRHIKFLAIVSGIVMISLVALIPHADHGGEHHHNHL